MNGQMNEWRRERNKTGKTERLNEINNECKEAREKKIESFLWNMKKKQRHKEDELFNKEMTEWLNEERKLRKKKRTKEGKENWINFFKKRWQRNKV